MSSTRNTFLVKQRCHEIPLSPLVACSLCRADSLHYWRWLRQPRQIHHLALLDFLSSYPGKRQVVFVSKTHTIAKLEAYKDMIIGKSEKSSLVGIYENQLETGRHR